MRPSESHLQTSGMDHSSRSVSSTSVLNDQSERIKARSFNASQNATAPSQSPITPLHRSLCEDEESLRTMPSHMIGLDGTWPWCTGALQVEESNSEDADMLRPSP